MSSTTRYGVSVSAGSKDGKRFAIYDRATRTVVQWHRTSKAAMRAVRKWNQKDRADD